MVLSDRQSWSTKTLLLWSLFGRLSICYFFLPTLPKWESVFFFLCDVPPPRSPPFAILSRFQSLPTPFLPFSWRGIFQLFPSMELFLTCRG